MRDHRATFDSKARDRASKSGGNQCRVICGYLKQVHRFKGADSRSASHIHRANHYPRKKGKAQQNRNAADRHLFSLYWKARTRKSCLNQQNGIGRTAETVRPTYRVPPIRS